MRRLETNEVLITPAELSDIILAGHSQKSRRVDWSRTKEGAQDTAERERRSFAGLLMIVHHVLSISGKPKSIFCRRQNIGHALFGACRLSVLVSVPNLAA